MLQYKHKLRLLPLTYEQLIILSQARNDLERLLNLNLSKLELNADKAFLEELSNFITDQFLDQVKNNPVNFEWFTHWLIIDENLNLTIGGIGTNGLPDEQGEVMIGYYIDKKFEGKGYGTEAVSLIIDWMTQTQNPDLKFIIADTLITGLGSQKVLMKNGFEFAGNTDEGYRWRYAV